MMLNIEKPVLVETRRLINLFTVVVGFWLLCAAQPILAADEQTAADTISLNLRDVSIAEAMEMISRKQRLNILLGEGVTGSVSLNLYSVSVEDAIVSIADAAGFAVEKRRGAWFIMSHDSVGQYSNGNTTRSESFSINYADPERVGEMLRPHLSQYGNMTVIAEQNLLIVTDKAEFLDRVAELIGYVDTQPQQVLIEAQILEVSLSDEDSYGIDWAKLFMSDGGEGSVGTQNLSGSGTSGTAGLLFQLVTPNVDLTLTALNEDGRVRTLSTPKLLALDNQEASVIIGDRRGYQVTTTINQVTTESIEFLESGVILRVTPHIDAQGRVLMEIHPEVSTGTVDANGIPSQATTEVETSLLVDNGQTVFIGGLMKHTANENYQRVPLLGRTPLIRRLFTNRERTNINTETIVLIRPQIVTNDDSFSREPVRRYEKELREMRGERDTIERRVEEERALPSLFGGHGFGGHGFDGLDSETSSQGGYVTAEPVELAAVASPESDAPISTDDTEGSQPARFPDGYYTVQLMAMSDQAAMDEYLRAKGVNGLSTVEVYSGGRPRVALLLGFFDSKEAAEAAAKHVPDALAGVTPWVRSLASLEAEQAQLAAH